MAARLHVQRAKKKKERKDKTVTVAVLQHGAAGCGSRHYIFMSPNNGKIDLAGTLRYCGMQVIYLSLPVFNMHAHAESAWGAS